MVYENLTVGNFIYIVEFCFVGGENWNILEENIDLS